MLFFLYNRMLNTPGWVTCGAWGALVSIAPFFIGTQIQGMLVMANPEYEIVRWRGTLLMWAVALVPMVINIFARRVLPGVEVAAGIMHVVFLPVTIAVLVILAPRNPDSFVWDTFVGGLSGWKDSGVLFSVGLLGVITPLSGTSLQYQTIERSNTYQQVSMASSTCLKKSKMPESLSPAP
jgi:hypothetical protein